MSLYSTGEIVKPNRLIERSLIVCVSRKQQWKWFLVFVGLEHLNFNIKFMQINKNVVKVNIYIDCTKIKLSLQVISGCNNYILQVLHYLKETREIIYFRVFKDYTW